MARSDQVLQSQAALKDFDIRDDIKHHIFFYLYTHAGLNLELPQERRRLPEARHCGY